ncbi:MAG TPA: 50S ribosomal protein L9 [Candidatus Omnitrophota bacterium]|nr:50S ribosomal protein L9 [Candidatus Omnitrophota bacterium]
MKVILLEEDRVVKVADGYARNYLLPKKLAILATPASIKQMEKRAETNKQKREELKTQAQALAEKLSSKEVVITADAGEEGKLFGTITNTDVVKAVKDTFEVELDRRKVNLNEHIKAIGDYVASVKLHTDVVAHLKLKVVKK